MTYLQIQLDIMPNAASCVSYQFLDGSLHNDFNYGMFYERGFMAGMTCLQGAYSF